MQSLLAGGRPPHDAKIAHQGAFMRQPAGRVRRFDYGSKTLHFGAGLDEAEAFELVRLIAERFPQLADLRRGEA